tara:strand:+ start:1774 stop:3762 length:1989 start_codon:yes stop_codon:yes gene_type:complete
MAVVDKNKLLGKSEKGGDLMVRPTTSLVGSPGGKITETSDEKDVVYTISTKLVKVDKFLKGTLAADKVAQKKEQKQKEDELRAEQEKDTEKPDDKKDEKETPKSLIPKLSFLDGIKKFLGDVLMGWLVFRLIKFLPKIVSFLKPAAAFVDWILKWGGKLLDGLITLVDWGYKAVEGTRSLMGNLFGEKGVEAFDAITGTLNTVFNLIAAIGLAAAAFTNEWFNQEQGDRNRIKDQKRQERYKQKGPEYEAEVKARQENIKKIKRQKFIDKWKKRLGIDQPKVQGPSTPPKPRGNFLGVDWGKRAAQVSEGFQGGMRKVSEIGDVVYRNTLGKIDEQLKKFDPGTILKNLQKGDGVINKAARGLGGFLDSPLTRKILNKAPFIGDAIVFLTDLASGKHWVRALLRTVGAVGVDAGFYGLLALTGIAAPFSAGSSLLLSAALVGAYMAADAAAGAALGNDGVGQFLGDWVADELGVPKKAGESGSGKWESLFGSGGKINNSAGSVKKMIEGVKGTLTDKQKESISRVGGGLGDPNVLKQEKTLSSRFDMKTGKGYINDQEVSMDEYEKFANMSMKEKLNQYGQIKGNAENILPLDVDAVKKKANSVSESASYEEGAEETIVVKSGSEGDDTVETETQGSGEPILVGTGGGGGNDEIGDLLYKGG